MKEKIGSMALAAVLVSGLYGMAQAAPVACSQQNPGPAGGSGSCGSTGQGLCCAYASGEVICEANNCPDSDLSGGAIGVEAGADPCSEHPDGLQQLAPVTAIINNPCNEQPHN
ncbi:MAG: hypothetical protein ACREQY_24020 [Candidatus Binatia bacterium]